MTSYFITGGAGFIGSHLVDRLLISGNSVTVYDSLVSGKKENIERHFGQPGFNFIQANIMDFDRLKGSLTGHDTVWHLAANTSITEGTHVTDLDLKNCTIGTYNVLEAMRLNAVKNLIFASSSCVYGDIPAVDLDETYGPLLPINLYGAGKLAGEAFISAYCSLFGIKAAIFRFGNVVGAGMAHGVIFDFIAKLRKNPAQLEILGDGRQEKNYFMVEDCIDGMICGFQKSGRQCDVFTLGNESTTTVTRIAQIICQEMSLKDVKFKYTGGRGGWAGDAPIVHFNTAKLKALGWRPRYDSDGAVRLAARRLLAGD